MNMLVDWGGFIKRQSKNWNEQQLRKCITEVRYILNYLEKKLQEVA